MNETPPGSASQRRGRLLKAAASMSVLTMTSRVLGLIRETVRASLLGTTFASDAFGIAFQIPNLLRRLVAEGAMSAGFIPVLSEVRELHGEDEAHRFGVRFFNLSLATLTVLTTLGVLGAGLIVALFDLVGKGTVAPETRELTVSLTRWMFPYIAFVSWAAVLQGVLNTYRVFWVSASTTIFMNLAVIGFALGLSQYLDQPVYGFAVGVLVGGVLQLLIQVPHVLKLGYRWRPDFHFGPRVRRAVWLLAPTVFGAGVYQINVLISQGIAWSLGPGAVSALQFSARLLELALGVFIVAISTVVLPPLSADAAAGRKDRVAETVLYAVRLACLLTFPATAALFLLRTETVSLLFERHHFGPLSSSMTGYALGFHALGLTHIALTRIFVPVFYAFKDTVTPVKIGFAAMIANVVACYALAPAFGHGGIALANTLSAFVQAALLVWTMRRHTGPMGDHLTTSSLLKSLVASAAMGAAIWYMAGALDTIHLRGTAQLLLPYTALILVAVTTYTGTALLLRHPDLFELVELIRRRLAR